MKWIGISGSWRASSPKVEADVRKAVQEIIARGDGIVTGGALNVDYFATDEALRQDPSATHIKVFLPATFEQYQEHYRVRAAEGVITHEQAHMLTEQMHKLQDANPDALIETHGVREVDREAYYARNQAVIDASDELMAFQVNESRGTQDAMDRARAQGKRVTCKQYVIPEDTQ